RTRAGNHPVPEKPLSLRRVLFEQLHSLSLDRVEVDMAAVLPERVPVDPPVDPPPFGLVGVRQSGRSLGVEPENVPSRGLRRLLGDRVLRGVPGVRSLIGPPTHTGKTSTLCRGYFLHPVGLRPNTGLILRHERNALP